MIAQLQISRRFVSSSNIYQWKTYLYLGLLWRERGAWAGPGTDNLPAGGCTGPPAEAAQIAGFAPLAFRPLFLARGVYPGSVRLLPISGITTFDNL